MDTTSWARITASSILLAVLPTSTDTDELVDYLWATHQTILAGWPDKNPGEWKAKPNQVGAYQFVAPELVEGTLRKGLAGLHRLAPGIARALYVMLMVSGFIPSLTATAE